MNFQKIIVTGGTKGIGRALIDQFLQKNCEIHVIARNFKSQPEGNNLFFHPIDLSQSEKVTAFGDNFLKTYGVPDLLINNAGSGAFYEWASFPEEEIYKQCNLLFLSPVLLCRKFVPAMAKEGRGSVLNVSSLATIYPLPFMPMYNSFKSCLSSYTRSMILEYSNVPCFIDLIVGDVCTNFNENVHKQPNRQWSSRMKKAWEQIQKQLLMSPNADVISRRIIKILLQNKSGVYYEGSILHRLFFPNIERFISFRLKSFFLQRRYFY